MVTKDSEGNPGNSQSDSSSSIDVAAVVKEINLRAISTLEVGKMEIGEYILDEIFHGKLDDALSRNPYKNQSLVDVSKHPDLLVNRRTIGGWVRAAFLKRTLTDLKVDCSNLTLSHFALLLQAQDDETRNDLAAKANKLGWSVKMLSNEIGKTKKAEASDGKMKALKKIVENPLAHFGNEESKKLLENSKVLQEDLGTGDRMILIKIIDQTRKKLLTQLDLIDAAKKRLVRIELDEPEPEPEKA